MTEFKGPEDLNLSFYEQSIARINEVYQTSHELCFVYVQHAFSPLIPHLSCLGDRLAAIIPKASSGAMNRSVVSQLEEHFPRRVFADINRNHLRNTDFTLNLLKRVTQGRPFAILEYGGYFAHSAEAITQDSELGPKLVGFVEGTKNGIKGADDGSTIGYGDVAHKIPKPIFSKSSSRIKNIMDQDIGPAIIDSCNNILTNCLGKGLDSPHTTIGVVGVGSIGAGILRRLKNDNLNPLVFDLDIAVMAQLAHSQHLAVPQEVLLANSDVVFLNTGSCFLAQKPSLLKHVKENSILVLCTSGDVEAGIPQLVAAKHLELVERHQDKQIATYRTCSNKLIRIMLGGDGVGQAPNLAVNSGSGSLANLMSDMEFYALGCYLAKEGARFPNGCVQESPDGVQDLIIDQWLQVFHPNTRQAPIDLTGVGDLHRVSPLTV